MHALQAILIALATQSPAGALQPEASRRGWAMFALVTLLGITLVATSAMLALLNARRRRKRRQRPVRAADPRDPWEVSAERMVEIKGPDPSE
ncbi:MAG: hypothetical protein AAGA55_09840 [Planctomycetota bacterium]